MIDSLNIGQVIYYFLHSDSNINTLVSDKIYPLVANLKNDTTQSLSDLLPFIIYSRDGLSTNGCKDGFYQNNVDFSIKVITKTYSQGITIANYVRSIFEGKTLTYNNITISDTILTNAFEEYNDNYSAFVQTIRFNTKIS